MRYVIGNWKANKSIEQAKVWLSKFLANYKPRLGLTAVVCPSYLHLPYLSSELKKRNSPLKLGSQNLSEYDNGPYTGEITARMLAKLVSFTLIGHSERRNLQKETDKQIENKAKQALKYGIKPILCVQGANTPIPKEVEIVAYEPVEAIGSGNPANPESANKILSVIKKSCKNIKAGIYGGSVNPQNVSLFLSQPEIDGVLPGGASLDPEEFAKIIKYASEIKA